MIAVSTPTGSCCGAMTVLARLSAMITKLPPKRADAGIKTRWSRAPSILSIWGVTRPTNPTEPAIVTATAVNNEAEKYNISLNKLRFMPKLKDINSPLERTFKDLEIFSPPTNPRVISKKWPR